MNEQHLDNLIQEQLDGALAVDRARELETAFGDNGEAGRIAQQYRELFDELGSLPTLEPPFGFRSRVLAELRERTQRQPSALRGIFPMLRYAAVLAFGFTLGWGLTSLETPILRESEVSGTMTGLPSSNVPGFDFAGPGYSGHLTARPGTSDSIELEIELQSQGPVQIVLDPEARFHLVDLETSGLKIESLTGEAAVHLDGSGRATLRFISGPGVERSRIGFQTETTPVEWFELAPGNGGAER